MHLPALGKLPLICNGGLIHQRTFCSSCRVIITIWWHKNATAREWTMSVLVCQVQVFSFLTSNRGRSWDKNLGRLTSLIERNIKMSSFSSGYFNCNEKIKVNLGWWSFRHYRKTNHSPTHHHNPDPTTKTFEERRILRGETPSLVATCLALEVATSLWHLDLMAQMIP